MPLPVFVGSACDSFRLKDGKLLHCGMSRIKLLELAGSPMDKYTQTLGVDSGRATAGKTVEVWSYRLQGSIGGEYLLTVTLSNGQVQNIVSEQQDRL
ncbi:hypothetical protein [Shewanella algae]|uniref:hypothetical protein n=1 Tax=Shewanella algae TaxID=38313 RepID=UPI001AAEEBD5|nr:hypothetical protein [Shewanella algae]EKT4487838.1 hypothetical protein [Shewanella algae]MBO2550142.1 hypothetical protein [Shewanella algae]